MAESFFATLKKEEIYGKPLSDREQTRAIVFEYIEGYYNRVRRHSTNGWVSPAEHERLYHQASEGASV